MALVQTPDGRSIYVPDYLAPPPDLMPPDPQMPPDPGYVPLGPDGYPQADDDPTRGQGGGAPPMGQGFPGADGAMPWDPGAFNRGKPAPRPRDDSARIGPLGFHDGEEIAGPQGVPSVTGGAMPNVRDQLAPIGTTSPQPQPSRDFVAGVVDNDPKVIAAKEKAYAKTTAAQAAQSRAQAAFNASPEGKAQAAGEGAAQAVEDRGQLAEMGGELEGQELDAISALKNEGLDNSKRIADEQAARVEESKKATAAKISEFDRLTKAELDYKVDDNRRWKEMGTGRTILFWISAAISGLGDALSRKPVGENMPLKMMQQAIQQDVDAQIRDHETLGKRAGFARSSIDLYRQATGDLQEARKLKVAEEYDRTAREIDAVASKYASPKAKLRAQDMSAQFRQQAQALRGASAEGIIQRDFTRQGLANQAQQTRISGGHLALANRAQKYDEKYKDKQLLLSAAALDNEAAKIAATGNAKLAEDVRARGVAAPPVAVTDPETGEITINRDTGVLKQANNQPWIIPTEKEAIEFRAKQTAADSIVDILDEIRTIRNKVGGESEWGNSPEFQRLQVLKDNLVGLKKAGMQGMSSDADMARIERMLGADSPASFRSQAAKLEEGREQVIKQLNVAAKKLHYNGDPITYADPTGSPMITEDDKAFKDSLKPASSSGAKSLITSSATRVVKQGARGGTKPEDVVKLIEDRAMDPKLSRSQRDAMMSMLAQGALLAENPEIRRKYQAALDSLGKKASAPEVEVYQQTQRETAPPVPKEP